MSHVDDFVDVERHVGKSTLVEVVFVPSASKRDLDLRSALKYFYGIFNVTL